MHGVHGSIVGWGTMQQAGRLWFPFPMRSLDLFNWPNPSSHTMALGFTQPLTEMSTRTLPEGKGYVCIHKYIHTYNSFGMKLKRKLRAIISYLCCPTLNFLRYLCNIWILWKSVLLHRLVRYIP
jgi:hypothetical protein